MNDNERKGPGEAAGDGRAAHGYRNEVSWDDGQGAQPYANQGDEEQGPGTAKESEAGNRGAASGRNLEQMEQLKRKPAAGASDAPREDVAGRGGVS